MTWILRIEQRRDVGRVRLEPPPTFPAFRSEWLPTVSLPDPGEGQRAYEERRALHPGHAGVLAIPESGLVCESPDGSTAVRLPPTRVRVFEPPREGRPDGWTGTIGPLAIDRTVTPEQLALGGSIRVSIRLAGEGNVWTADPRLEKLLAPDRADVFVHPPDFERDAGRTLVVRHYQVYDVVPRREGPLELPAIRIPYLDPLSLRYGEARLAPFVVAVGPAPVPEPTPRVAPSGPESAADSSAPRSGLLLPGLLLVALVAAGLVVLRRRAAGPGEPWRSVGELVASGETRLAEGDVDAAAAGITRALQRILDSRSERERGEPEGDALQVLKERLERVRFGGEPDAAELRSAVAEGLEALRGLLERER